jgi:hypothetical protein
VNVLARELAVNGRESVELVLEEVLVLVVEVAVDQSEISQNPCDGKN